MKKNNFLCWFILSCSAFQSFAQNTTKIELLKEINRDVWQPFIEGYKTADAEKYLSIHSQDFIRGMGNEGKLTDLEGYAQGVRKMFEQLKQAGNKVAIDFRFLKRIVSEKSAYEIGIYKFTVYNAKGVAQHFYGKFHVTLRKEKNSWKILVDYDANEQNEIQENSFLEGFPLDDFSKF